MKEADKKNSFLGIDKNKSSYKESDLVILPIEYSESKRKSVLLNSAKEIIKASYCLEKYDEEMGIDIFAKKNICTLQTLNLASDSYRNASSKISKIFQHLLDDNKIVVSISGSHAIALSLVKAANEKYPDLSILHLDSKANMKSGSDAKTNHECMISRITEFNSRIVQVGIRSMSEIENEFRKKNQIHQFQSREIKMGMYGNDWQEIVEKNLSDHLYITIDLSVFDPSIFPSVENPEPGGLLWDEVLSLIKIVGSGRTIVGVDVCGLIPNKKYPESNYFAAKLVYKIMNYVL